MIELRGIEKHFGKLQILKGVNLQIETGCVTAIVGPNGSGKTTLIKTILGLVQPDKGDIFIGERRLNLQSDYKSMLGYMPQIAKFPDNLTANEVIEMLKDLRNNPANCDEELLPLFRLESEMNKPLRALSGGTRQKVSAVIAFLFQPEILIFDEPTAGLDPISSSHFKDKILREKANGKTFILTSHIMSEIEELADRIVYLLEGNIFFASSPEEIKQQTGENKLERAMAKILEKIQ